MSKAKWIKQYKSNQTIQIKSNNSNQIKLFKSKCYRKSLRPAPDKGIAVFPHVRALAVTRLLPTKQAPNQPSCS
jgi:hypothetical protein